jgi:hypothetical protein
MKVIGGEIIYYDYCPQGSHHRLGFGGECQTERYRFTVNGYLPLSQWRQDNQQSCDYSGSSGSSLVYISIHCLNTIGANHWFLLITLNHRCAPLP